MTLSHSRMRWDLFDMRIQSANLRIILKNNWCWYCQELPNISKNINKQTNKRTNKQTNKQGAQAGMTGISYYMISFLWIQRWAISRALGSPLSIQCCALARCRSEEGIQEVSKESPLLIIDAWQFGTARCRCLWEMLESTLGIWNMVPWNQSPCNSLSLLKDDVQLIVTEFSSSQVDRLKPIRSKRLATLFREAIFWISWTR